jgi:putative ABC transport system ATP-binding protein
MTMSSPNHSSAPPSAQNGRNVYDGQATTLDSKQTRAPGVQPVIAVRQLMKYYTLGQTRVPALRGVTFAVNAGEFVAVMGASGSGKSTLMNLIGCLDKPSGGEYWLAGTPVSTLTSDQLADIRNRRIGFVFQGFNLLSRASALKNVALPMMYAGLSPAERERRARRALDLVGLASRANHTPLQLSGGQQQRVAIARALVNRPALLLADEPTGNLDSRTSLEIMAVLQTLNQHGITILLVTHEADIAAYAKRQITFRDGRVLSDERNAAPRDATADLLRVRQQSDETAARSQVRIQEEPR